MTAEEIEAMRARVKAFVTPSSPIPHPIVEPVAAAAPVAAAKPIK